MITKKGFIFIETIIVVCVLTVSLMSLYSNYSKIMTNTKELNTFDTTEYNYKTYFLKKKYKEGIITGLSTNDCNVISSDFSEGPIEYGASTPQVKICLLENAQRSDYISTYKSNFDAYIIDYLLNQDLTTDNDNLFLVEYKKEDKQNPGEYFTFISSLNY